jgi:hypothetical protein
MARWISPRRRRPSSGFMRYTVNIGIVCIAIIIFLAIFAV